MKLLRWALGGLLLGWFCAAAAQNIPVLTVTPDQDSHELRAVVAMLDDPGGLLTLADIVQKDNQDRFETTSLKRGFKTSAVWLRMRLNSPVDQATTWWFDTGSHIVQEVDFYWPDATGQYQHASAGSTRPFSDRPLPTANFVFPLELPSGRPVDVYLRLQSYGLMPVNSAIRPVLWKPQVYQLRATSVRTQWYFYLGMAAALCIFNFVLYLAMRELSYLLYVFSLLSVVWWVSSGGGGNGWSYELFWPNMPLWEQMSWPAAILAAVFFPMVFVWHFLDLRNTMPKLYRVAQGIQLVVVLLVGSRVVITALQWRHASAWMEIAFVWGNAIAVPLLLVTFAGMGIQAWRGSRAARVLIVAWGPLVLAAVGSAISALTGHGPASYLVLWGSALELTLMSLALADRYNQERKAKMQAQAEKLLSLQQSERELEAKVAQRTQELHEEQTKTRDLLNNMLPASVASELAETGTTQPVRHDATTVLFTDFSGFTEAASSMPASRMVAELNDIFAAFDRITDECGVEKIKTIGDAYMAAAGVPLACEDHALRAVRAGLRMVQYVQERNVHATFKWNLRVGVHTGPVVSGVVGIRKFAFDIWGDTVNIASRMESSGEAGRVNVSAYTYDLIRNDFVCEYRGKVSAKGKGEVDMYFVQMQ